MSILAAKCPCCGRDIGIEENSEEYTCVFCGTKLKVSALKTELVNASGDSGSSGEDGSSGSRRRSHHSSRDSSHHSSHGSSHHSSHGSSHRSSHGSDSDPDQIDAPELTQEEIDEQLKRKAEYKEELHSALHQINELRARRPKLDARLRAVVTLGVVGVVLAVFAAICIVFSATRGEGGDVMLIVSCAVALVALAMLITSAIRRNDIKKQKSRLEESIIEKKQKRDVLIGRLNKINKTLHIHSDE